MAPNARYGHSTTLYGKKIYLYGGKIKVNNNFSYLADLDIFNLGILCNYKEDKHWIPSYIPTKNYLKPRRNHIAELIGNQIFIHGGFDEDSNVLSDSNLLNLTPNLKWMKVSTSSKTNPPALAGHTSCLVVAGDIKSNIKFNIYQFPTERGYKSKSKRVCK